MSRDEGARELHGRCLSGIAHLLFRPAFVGLLVGSLASCRSTPAPTTAQVDPPPKLDVVTLNLWHDRSYWPRRQALIVDALRRLQPDIILLQEVLQDAGLPNQAGSLAAQLGYQWHFVSADPPERVRRYGNAILTRQAPLARGGRLLQPLDDYRVAGWVRIEVKGRPVHAYVAHLNFTDASGATRATQVRDLLSLVEATRGDAPVVIAGDFNTAAGSPELAPLRVGYIDGYATANVGSGIDTPPLAGAHVTLNPHYHAQPYRIDHVFAQCGAFDVLEAQRILDSPAADGLWPSDHFGIRVRLRLRSRSEVIVGPCGQ
jgi:endonuclease/exonuclease/phosphatase family metal-dependent hydrolase